MDRRRTAKPSKPQPILQVQDLQVYYGESHALQGVSLTLERGVLSVVGRNGMGKTTLCNAIEDALAPYGVKVYEQHLPPVRILELMGAIEPDS